MGEESNKIKWIGIRPASEQAIFQCEPGPWATTRGGVTRTQITKSASLANGYATIHTVTTGKTFYLTSFNAHLSHSAAAVLVLGIFNSGNTVQYYLSVMEILGSFSISEGQSFNMPIVIPSTYYIKLTAITGGARALITGWEE